jgi:hypothetical protein
MAGHPKALSENDGAVSKPTRIARLGYRRGMQRSLLFVLLAAPVGAQSFNVDLGPNILFAPAPSPQYGGAAQQPGTWNAFQPTFTARPILDITGAATGVTLRSDSVSSFTVFPTVMPAGDDQRLMEDFQITPNLNTLVTWTIAGLAVGTYDLFVYASDPTNASLQTTIGVPSTGLPTQDIGVGWPGAHALGQTYAYFRVAVPAGQLDFTGTVVGGQFASGVVNGFQLVEVPPQTLGTTYCTSNPNSTGVVGHVVATGSTSIAAADLRLEARRLPTLSFAYFLTSETQGNVANPGGSQGILCVGGSVGRFNTLVGQSDASGVYTICTQGCPPGRTFSLGALPQPTGPVAAVAGETWNFQCWFRDSVAGAATSNFTDGLALTLN